MNTYTKQTLAGAIAEYLPMLRKAIADADAELFDEGFTVRYRELMANVENIVTTFAKTMLSGGEECCVPDADEPRFVLLGRDPQAPDLIERWAADRERAEPDSDKIAKARTIAADMRAYKDVNPYKGMRRELYTPPAVAAGEAEVLAMVDRFLAWRFPEDFAPDGGISYTPLPRLPEWTHDTRPTGTNLLTAIQARAMLEYVLAAQGGSDG